MINHSARLHALLRTVLWPCDLVLAATSEEALLQRCLDHLVGSDLFQAAAIMTQDQVWQQGRPTDCLAPLTRTVYRRQRPWGLLRVWMDPTDSADPDVEALIDWAAPLLSQSLDLWDAQHQLQQELAQQEYRALHDHLTGLENRAAFLPRLPAALEEARQSQTLLVVGLLDLDDFKPINDTYGHGAGDEVLRQWSHRLLTWMHGAHTVARIGGDEFLFLLSGFTHHQAVETFLTDCLQDLASPLMIPDRQSVVVHTSLGLTAAPDDPADPDGLIRHADWALYRSKEFKTAREHPWVWYQPPLTTPSRFHSAIPQDLRVHYQPIVDGATGQVQSLEALVRLQDGSRLLAPAQFLPQLSPAELETLTFGVLDHVLTDLRQLDRDASPVAHHLSVALNLEPSMLSPTCIDHIEAQVRHAAVDPRRITLELLETSDFLSKDLAKSQLRILKQRQFQLALDDVGSAYSSLLRIKELPIDTFKLDQAFVRHIPENPDDLLFVISIQTLARGFQAHFIAEGVETADILDALQVLGVDRIQGYVFTRPLALSALRAWFRAFTPVPALQEPQTWLGAYAAHLAHQFLDRILPTHGMPRHSIQACPLTGYLRHHGAFEELAAQHRADHLATAAGAPDGTAHLAFKSAFLHAAAISAAPSLKVLPTSRG